VAFSGKVRLLFSMGIRGKCIDADTVYNFDALDVDRKPEVTFKYLKKIGWGERI